MGLTEASLLSQVTPPGPAASHLPPESRRQNGHAQYSHVSLFSGQAVQPEPREAGSMM
jgi:hypothetical protein